MRSLQSMKTSYEKTLSAFSQRELHNKKKLTTKIHKGDNNEYSISFRYHKRYR
ncbi:hypothetical protein BCEN4_740149 [Burkholderia cenocepacia]|nr:hypothetical protein BCEN4_740149 [Burkholderia cenocepacia]